MLALACVLKLKPLISTVVVHCGVRSVNGVSHFNSTVLILGFVCLCVWVVWLDLFLFVFFFSERILLMISAKLLFFSEKKRKRGR